MNHLRSRPPEGATPVDSPGRPEVLSLEAACEKARSLVQEALRARPGWRPPPFDPRVYAELLGVAVSYTEEPVAWDAILLPAGGSCESFRIVCNAAVRSCRRMAFSLAHEIAHVLLEDPGTLRYRAPPGAGGRFYETAEERELERLCDGVAAELLMPQPWFSGALARHGLRASTVPRLAEEFGVSLEAAAVRLVETAEELCAVGFFELALPPSARGVEAPAGGTRRGAPEPRTAYRVRRVFPSRGFPYLFPAGKSVPDASVIYRASLQLGEQEATEEFRLGPCEATLRVTAYPLHRGGKIAGPPLVCAVLASG